MTSFKLDSANNLQFGSDFTLVSGTEALVQDIRTLLLMFSGENPFNTDEGLNYYNLMQNMQTDELKNAIIERVKSDSRVKSVKNVTSTYKGKELDISLQVLTQWGEVINV